MAKGLSRYFTGKQCKRGHISQRITSNGTCEVCYSQDLTRWRSENSERIRQTEKEYWSKNKAAKNAKDRRYREKHVELVRQKDKERYARTPRDVLRKHRRDRKARVKNAPGSHTLLQLEQMFDRQKGRCAACFIKLTMKNKHLDHIFAVTRSGSNSIENLQWLCATCNLRKHNKDPFVWAQENGRLL